VSIAAGLTGIRWPAHPHRQEDELLSSWFVRSAHANCLKAQSFGSQAFGRRTFVMTRDLDRCATDTQIEVLSRCSGSSPEELRDGMLTAYESRVFERHNAFGNTKWILPSVSYVRQRRRYGMQFCPLCLFFDKEPYYRKRWRMAFVTVCDVHGTMLHDRCQACGAPVAFGYNDHFGSFRLANITCCWECGFDLRRSTARIAVGPDAQSVISMRSLATFHDLGWWFQGCETISYGPLYFDVLHRLVHFFATRYGQRFLKAIELETGWFVNVTKERSRCEFESRPLAYRHEMLMAVLWLLNEWPHRFVRLAKCVGGTQSQLNDGDPFPYWFESILRLELGNGYYMLSGEEVRSAVTYLERSGENVSASAIRRLVGGNPSGKAVKPYAKSGMQAFSNEELQQLFTHFDDVHAASSSTSRARLVWQRDKMILQLMNATGSSYRKIRRMVVDSIAPQQVASAGQDALPATLINLLSNYLENTRRHMAGKKSGGALFIKWKGGALTGASWKCRYYLYRDYLISKPGSPSPSEDERVADVRFPTGTAS